MVVLGYQEKGNMTEHKSDTVKRTNGHILIKHLFLRDNLKVPTVGYLLRWSILFTFTSGQEINTESNIIVNNTSNSIRFTRLTFTLHSLHYIAIYTIPMAATISIRIVGFVAKAPKLAYMMLRTY